MKAHSVLSWFTDKLLGIRKPEKMKLLQQQRLLLHQGLETTAEVIETAVLDARMGRLLPVKLWLKLKKNDGGFLYTFTTTLVSIDHLPGKGDLLRIKYQPGNMECILIL